MLNQNVRTLHAIARLFKKARTLHMRARFSFDNLRILHLARASTKEAEGSSTRKLESKFKDPPGRARTLQARVRF